MLFVIGPITAIADGVRAQAWPIAFYGVVAIFGAVGAAFAFRVLDLPNLGLLGLLALLLIPVGLVRVLTQGADADLWGRVGEAIKSLLFYVRPCSSWRKCSFAAPLTRICTATRRKRLDFGCLRLGPVGAVARANRPGALDSGGADPDRGAAGAGAGAVLVLAKDRKPGDAGDDARAA